MSPLVQSVVARSECKSLVYESISLSKMFPGMWAGWLVRTLVRCCFSVGERGFASSSSFLSPDSESSTRDRDRVICALLSAGENTFRNVRRSIYAVYNAMENFYRSNKLLISSGTPMLSKCSQFVKKEKIWLIIWNMHTKFSSNNAFNLFKVLKYTVFIPQYSK